MGMINIFKNGIFGKKQLNIYIILLLSAFGMSIIYCITKWGVGISSDSVAYISAARNMVTGLGISMLDKSGKMITLTHFPPFFSFLIAALSSVGVSLVGAARYINILIFGGNIFLAGMIVNRITRGFVPAVIFVAALITISFDMIRISSMAWSEPLFVFLCFMSMLLLSSYVEKNSGRALYGAACLAATAFLTRYAAVPLIITGFVTVLFFGGRPFVKRVRDAVIYCGISILPMGVWIARNIYLSDSPTDMGVKWHFIPAGNLKVGVFTCVKWLFPWLSFVRSTSVMERAVLPVIAAMFFIIAAIIVVKFISLKKREKAEKKGAGGEDRNCLPCILAAFIPVYAAFIFLSNCLIDSVIPLDFRILAPVYVAALILLIYVIRHIYATGRYAILVFFLCVVLSVSYLYSFGNAMIGFYQKDIMISAKNRQGQDIVRTMESIPAGIKIYSNRPDILYMFTGRKAVNFSSIVDLFAVEKDLSKAVQMMDIFRDRSTVLIYFQKYDLGEGDKIFPKRLVKHLGLDMKDNMYFGTLWRGYIISVFS